MARQADTDQGFSVRLDRETERLVREAAEREDRTIKAVLARAVRKYVGAKMGD